MQGFAPLGEYLRYAVTLTAVLDPFFAVPIFVSVTARRTTAGRLALARGTAPTVFGRVAGTAPWLLLGALGIGLVFYVVQLVTEPSAMRAAPEVE